MRNDAARGDGEDGRKRYSSHCDTKDRRRGIQSVAGVKSEGKYEDSLSACDDARLL